MIRELQLAVKARRTTRAGNNLRIVLEARRAGLPISLAFALVEQESGFRNVFGHDAGADPRLKGKKVTPARVQQLLRGLGRYSSNGVGLTQLTWPGFIREAEHLGGAHRPANQLRVGFNLLAGHLRTYGDTRRALAAYNAGISTSAAGLRYAEQVLARRRKWHDLLS